MSHEHWEVADNDNFISDGYDVFSTMTLYINSIDDLLNPSGSSPIDEECSNSTAMKSNICVIKLIF